MLSVSIQEQDFDLGAELQQLRLHGADHGALASFCGVCRSHNHQGEALIAMSIEQYPPMTYNAITQMCQMAHQRFAIVHSKVIHRFGRITPQEQIVLVAVTAAHRAQAFAACEFLMDYLKTQAPFWKKEITQQGSYWVEAKASDDQAAARWGIQSQLPKHASAIPDPAKPASTKT